MTNRRHRSSTTSPSRAGKLNYAGRLGTLTPGDLWVPHSDVRTLPADFYHTLGTQRSFSVAARHVIVNFMSSTGNHPTECAPLLPITCWAMIDSNDPGRTGVRLMEVILRSFWRIVEGSNLCIPCRYRDDTHSGLLCTTELTIRLVCVLWRLSRAHSGGL